MLDSVLSPKTSKKAHSSGIIRRAKSRLTVGKRISTISSLVKESKFCHLKLIVQHIFIHTAYIDNKDQGDRNQMHCDFNTPAQAGKACTVDVSNFGPCNSKNGFGYNSSSPCVFLKLNRVRIVNSIIREIVINMIFCFDVTDL